MRSLYYIFFIIEVISTYICYIIQGYNYNPICYSFMMYSIVLLIFIKISIIGIIYYINNYTLLIRNRYYYIVLKGYILLVIYLIINNLMEVI